METKIRLLQLNIKQLDLIPLLAERGISANRSEISLAINGRMCQKKHEKIVEAINQILDEREGK